MTSTIVILGTGGTIAGTASNPLDNVGYTAAQRSVADLVAAVPALGRLDIELAQVAQLDSKDMDHGTWQRLALVAQRHLARPEVAGLVITHGTDTLEETAGFLHHALAPAKPVVLTAAMRPATALLADGPQNLLDAVTLAGHPGAHGVLVAFAGRVHAATAVRKLHPYRLDAFGSGEAGPLALLEEGRLRPLHALADWPRATVPAQGWQAGDPQAWPWVEVVTSHAGAGGRAVAALVAAGVAGLVVAATGNGTVHGELQAALDAAQAAGVVVWRCTRCAEGHLVSANPAHAGPAAAMSPWQARTALLLSLLSQRCAATGGGG
jgi:L-asparaginase